MAKKTKEIADLDQRISSFKQKSASHARQTAREQRDYSRAGVGFQISTVLLSGVLVGAAIGYFLDEVCGTKPWLLAIFTIFGGAAGILNIYRTFKDETPQKGRK